FGRHANDAPSEPEWSPEWSPDWPADEPPPAPAPQPQYQVPPPSYPPPPPPPNPYVAPNYAQTPGVVPAPYYQHPYQVTAGPPAVPTDQFAQAGVGAPQTGPNSTPVTPDQQGLAAAVSKLAPASQHSGTVAFCVVGGLLATDEVVLTAVQGWALGMPTVAVLTNTRVLVVSERRWKPLVEAFSLRPGLTIFGRHVDHQASVTFQEGDRVVTLDQVADVPIAVELATTARARSTGTGF
ncbi:MAG TPA: hypothetical protein VJM33_06905, partial [Microthrixaceae bacterium]|nr:hypothetical protein [Microthrixaceae bacterium]